MSLKNFHVLFVSLAVVLALYCAAQAIGGFIQNGSVLAGFGAAASLAGSLLLVRFETRFLRRCREAGIR